MTDALAAVTAPTRLAVRMDGRTIGYLPLEGVTEQAWQAALAARHRRSVLNRKAKGPLYRRARVFLYRLGRYA